MFSRIVFSCAFCASAAWLPIATAGFLTFDNGTVDLRFEGTFGPEGGWTIIDGKLTNIGVDGVTRPLIVTEGYFWHENPDDGPGVNGARIVQRLSVE